MHTYRRYDICVDFCFRYVFDVDFNFGNVSALHTSIAYFFHKRNSEEELSALELHFTNNCTMKRVVKHHVESLSNLSNNLNASGSFSRSIIQ